MRRTRIAWIAVLLVCFGLKAEARQTPTFSSDMRQAIWNGDLPIIKRLLATGADPLTVEDRATPPLLAPWEWAVLAGNNDALHLLLEKVPKIPAGDERAKRRLATAAAMNNVVATRELLRRGLPVDILSSTGNG